MSVRQPSLCLYSQDYLCIEELRNGRNYDNENINRRNVMSLVNVEMTSIFRYVTVH